MRKSKRKNSTKINWKDVVLHVLMGLLPAYGVWVLKWNIFTIVFLFSFETIVIGLFHFLKLKLSPQKDGSHTFFLLHYGIFVFVQSILLTVFFWPGKRWDGMDFLHGAGYVVLFNSIGFVKEYFESARFQDKNYSINIMEPYARIFTQQFFIIIGGIFVLGSEDKNENIMVVLFVLFKIIFELVWVIKPPLSKK
jgi:hypothetical protein